MICRILRDFKGSQDGRHTEQFKAGTEVDLSPYLMASANPEDFKPVIVITIENKAIIADGAAPGGRTRKVKA